MPTLALLLIAHGSRNPQANADLHHLARGLRASGYSIVVPSYLELAEPSIEAGGQDCVSQGATQVVMVPYFLSSGVHVLRDLTRARDDLAAANPHVEFILAEPLGNHPLILTVVAERAREALQGSQKNKEQ